MTDLEKFEIVENGKGEHFKFVKLEHTEAEADKLCKELFDNGFNPAKIQREDNKLWEIFIKFTTADEIIFLYEQNNCLACPAEKKEDCHPKSCKIRGEIEDIRWKDKLGFEDLLEHDLKLLKAKQPKTT